MAQVIQFPGAGAKAPAAMMPGQAATVFQFPIKVKPAPRDKISARRAARRARECAREHLGKRLYVVRTILGLSIEAAASAAGTKPFTFANYERGISGIREDRLRAFISHPTIMLRGFLLNWLLEDGNAADKDREIFKHCRSIGLQISREAAGAVNALGQDICFAPRGDR